MPTKQSKEIAKTVARLLKEVPSRNKDIIVRRFGLKNGKKETLESIGQSYNVTRERVRQIEEASLSQLKDVFAGHGEVEPYVSLARQIVSDNGGVIKEDELFEQFSGNKGDSVANASLAFILTLHGELARFSENDGFHSFWAINKNTLDNFKSSSGELVRMLDKTGRVVPEQDFHYLAQKNNIASFSSAGKPISPEELNVAMAISKELDKNIFAEIGLARWPEVKPKGVRDKAYLVLKRENEPKHFSEIAKLINTIGFNNRKANVQTVHNELIKDNRFILVGRGMYALSEWGYKAGTVKDVLVDILKSAGRPLAKTTLMAKVMDARMVKENTVLLNLQDSKTFVRNADGTYSLRSGR